MRQLYRSVIVPTTDYAASSWFSRDKWGTERHIKRLQRVQKLGAQIVLRSFKRVSAAVLEAEAYLEPVVDRLTKKVAKHLQTIFAAEEDNPAWTSIRNIKSRGET